MAVILKDVAARAGCSIATVSKILNHRDEHISEPTRQRVLALVKEMDYQPNALSRSLRLRRTSTIGYVAPNLSIPFYAEVAQGIQDVALKHNYAVILCDSRDDPQLERSCVSAFEERLVDGFVISPTVQRGPMGDVFGGLLPIVAVDRPLNVTAPHVGSVTSDLRAAAREATELLLDRGCRRVGFLSPKDGDRAARFEGYCDALDARGIVLDPSLVYEGGSDVVTGERGGRILLDLWADGAVCGNDLIAAGVLSVAASMKIPVPDKFKIIGMDNIPIAQYFNPPLTTVDRKPREMGSTAATMLLNYIFNRSPLSAKEIGCHIVSRRSV